MSAVSVSYTERELEMYERGMRVGRREAIEELRVLLGLDKCPHCEHTKREHE